MWFIATDFEKTNKTTAQEEEADEELVRETFATVMASKKRPAGGKVFEPSAKKRKKRQTEAAGQDRENYIPYHAPDHHAESG